MKILAGELNRVYEMVLGPVADPGPFFWSKWIEKLTADQQSVVMQRAIEQRINLVSFQMKNLESELEMLKTVKSMIKEKGP